MTATLRLDRSDPTYRPGEHVSGHIRWTYNQPPISAEVRLAWHTDGKGTREHVVVDRDVLLGVRATENREFRLMLPEMPYSFTGSILAIVWQIELVLGRRGSRRDRIDASVGLVMSPTGRPIDPYSVR